MAAVLLAGFMHFTMLMMIVSPGISAGRHMDDIRKNIDKAQANYDDLDTKWKAVFTAQGALNQKSKDDIVSTFDAINVSIDAANKSHKQFKDTNKQIQYIGVMMVFFVFFLLLLKQFDLFDTINNFLLYPFTFFNKK